MSPNLEALEIKTRNNFNALKFGSAKNEKRNNFNALEFASADN